MIFFTSIKWKNFLSTGNVFTEIKLNKHKTTLIIGKNGSGKSTLLDAITFALFGKPFRKINKPQVLNSINQKDCVVELYFDIGNKKYKIVRGLKPSVFEIFCDDVLINQDAKSRDYQDYLEKFIIKMNFKSFTQIVILGSASFVPFMQLSAADRRSIIEDLLDIQIFSSMNVILKQKSLEAKDTLISIKHDIDLLNVKIESTRKMINEIKSKNMEKINVNLVEIEDNHKQIEEITQKTTLIEKHIDILQKKLENFDKNKKQLKSLMGIEGKIENRTSKIKKEIEFYKTYDDCPTCHQVLDKTFKTESITQNETKLSELELGLKDIETKITSISEKISDMEKIMESIKDHQSEIIKHNTTIKGIHKYIDKLQKENNELVSGKNSYLEEENNIIKFEEDRTKLDSKKEDIMTDQQYYEIAAGLLKDTGIKTKIIKQYLPIINKTINKYLTSMDFFVNFTLNESFEESIKSRHRDDFSYENFSEGEKQKIDLALLFTWRTVAKLKNSINTNLLLLDEVFDSSLDSNATEELLKILNSFSDGLNIWVISHKDDILFDKFSQVIKFEKVNNFSRIAG
jgi:DNA repair exonuclease SbcCD ATPase subunit